MSATIFHPQCVTEQLLMFSCRQGGTTCCTITHFEHPPPSCKRISHNLATPPLKKMLTTIHEALDLLAFNERVSIQHLISHLSIISDNDTRSVPKRRED